MVDALARNWVWVAVRGAAALLFGLLTLLNPAISLAALILFFGAYALINGVFAIGSALANRRGAGYGIELVLAGVLSIVIGVLTFLLPGVTALVLLYFIAAWAIVAGVAEIAVAVRLRRAIRGEWWLIVAGALSVLFGVLLIVFPGAGALTVVLWIGAYATIFGVLLLALALRLRRWRRDLDVREAARGTR